MLFADLLSLHLVTFLMFFFILVHITFFSSRCMLELKLAIYYRAASLPSQASYTVLAQESSITPRSISNSAILRNNYISVLSDLCACVHGKKNGAVKEAIVLQWAVRIASEEVGHLRWARDCALDSIQFRACNCMFYIPTSTASFPCQDGLGPRVNEPKQYLAVPWSLLCDQRLHGADGWRQRRRT